MAIADINPNVIGAGPVSKADLRAQLTIIETELQAIYDSTPWRRIARYVVANGAPGQTIPLPAGYESYEIELDQVALVNSGTHLGMRYSTNGGVSFISTVGNYNGVYQAFNTAAANANVNAVDAAGYLRLAVSVAPSALISGKIRLPAISGVWTGEWRTFFPLVTSGLATVNDGAFVLTSAANAIQLFPGSGNMSGGIITISGRRV
jgi:hypothetical protein